MNDEPVYRTAPATQGMLNINILKEDTFQGSTDSVLKNREDSTSTIVKYRAMKLTAV